MGVKVHVIKASGGAFDVSRVSAGKIDPGPPPSREALLGSIRGWAAELGFSQIGVAGIDLSTAEPGLQNWMAAGFAGSMGFFERHGLLRARPAELVPGTVRVITARMDHVTPRPLPIPDTAVAGGADDAQPGAGPDAAMAAHLSNEWRRLADPLAAQVALYARGRDYHRVLRPRLARLAERIAAAVGPFGGRAFTDSAPVLEAELAVRSGLGWRGKHTLVLNRDGGSMFFLGELFVDFDLPLTEPVDAHCGRCSACIDICPTQAIIAPGRLDARRCISYLTIEHDGPIPPALRRAIGNRIFGCDDCQLVCPWNKYAQPSSLPDFEVRGALQAPTLLDLWQWTPQAFERHTEGSAIRRIGWVRWRRNLAVGLGNALASPLATDNRLALRQALMAARDAAGPLVQEHIDWALAQGVADDTRAQLVPTALPP